MQAVDLNEANNKKQKENIDQIHKQFEIQNVIGSGTFGTVYFAHWINHGENVAIKRIAKKLKYKNKEVQFLCSLKHPNVTNLLMHYQAYDEVSNKYFINLVMEYLPTTLFSLIKSANLKRTKISIINCVSYTRKIFQGLAYLQQKNVCHRDIKPSNILIDEQKGKIQICDFGSAKQLKNGESSITYVCSRYYRAPQLILGCSNYTTKIDIWSAGCVIAEMITCLPLFDGANNADQLVKIIRVLGPPTKQDLLTLKVDYLQNDFQHFNPLTLSQKIKKGNSNCPIEFIDLLQKLLVYNPNIRLTARQALDHALFRKFQQR